MSQIQEAYQTLTEIDQLLADIELKITNITGAETTQRLEQNLNTFRQLERLALRYLTLARRMGLPEDVGAAIDFLARLVVAIRMAHISISMMMATNPLTAAIGVAGLIGTAVTMTDSFAGYV